MEIIPVFARLVVFLLCLAPATAYARETAPLPGSFRDDTKRGEYDVYDEFPETIGTYAHGVSGGPILDGADPAEEVCEGTEREREVFLEKYSSANKSEYWYYGTSTQGVLFLKSIQPVTASENFRKCEDLVLTSYEIQRAYVANGFIHNFVFRDHQVPGLGSYRLGTSANEYSGSFLQLQSLMARSALPDRRQGRAWSRDKVAGEPVICDGTSGMVWSLTCYASRRPIRGMVLRSEAGDDVQTLFQNHVLEIEPNILLPGVVFEVDRDWRLREDG